MSFRAEVTASSEISSLKPPPLQSTLQCEVAVFPPARSALPSSQTPSNPPSSSDIGLRNHYPEFAPGIQSESNANTSHCNTDQLKRNPARRQQSPDNPFLEDLESLPFHQGSPPRHPLVKTAPACVMTVETPTSTKKAFENGLNQKSWAFGASRPGSPNRGSQGVAKNWTSFWKGLDTSASGTGSGKQPKGKGWALARKLFGHLRTARRVIVALASVMDTSPTGPIGLEHICRCLSHPYLLKGCMFPCMFLVTHTSDKKHSDAWVRRWWYCLQN
jgi:hypothetical protein